VHLYAWRKEIAKFPKLFLKFVCSFDIVINSSSSIEPNSDSHSVSELIKTIMTSVYLYFTGKEMDTFSMKELSKNISQFSRISNGITALVEYATVLVKVVIKSVSFAIMVMHDLPGPMTVIVSRLIT
jgi:hypothetical protein